MTTGLTARWMRTTFFRGALLGKTPVPEKRLRARRSVVALSTAAFLAVPVGLAPVAQAASGGALGRPSVAAAKTTPVHTPSGEGAKKARAHVAKTKKANLAAAQRAAAERKVTWPTPDTASATVSATGATALKPGGLPLRLARHGAHPATGKAHVRVLSQKAATAAGVDGVLLSAQAQTAGTARLSLDYSSFASAYGGDWAGRLRLVQLPSCALTTPTKAKCRVQTPVASASNDAAAESLTADVALPTTTQSAMVLAATAATGGESASGSGNYSATPLSASSTWQAGGSSGSFTWSYDFSAPPAAAGPAPDLSLSYDSGSVDGLNATTNNQGSQLGEGFDITSSYIERSYGSCDQDGQSGKYDDCWKYDNASIVLNGKSTELVKDDTSGQWRLADDDDSTVTHMTGGDNGDNDGEYWIVTTGDGTKYYFGLNKLPGADDQRTDSVWTVPVYGDDAGEPCHGSTFADSSCDQAWRWNLDYVVDPHANAMSYWYTPETNYYAKNGASTGTAEYTRGGYLSKILYGQRSDTLFSATAPEKIELSYDERCTASDCSSLTKDTANNWPDVPFDSICDSGKDCDATGPGFFTRKRLTKVETFAWSTSLSPAAYQAVDAWSLKQSFVDVGDVGDSSDQVLTLDSVQHTGEDGTPITLDPVTFTYQMRPNRVDSGSDDILPLTRPRISTITSETGAITDVTLSSPECVRGSNMPASEDDDTKSCYPLYWRINGATEETLDWFNKYRVLAVTASDPAGQNDAVEHSYSYFDPAWHYNSDPFTQAGERTWSIWRGYEKVITTTGASDGTQSKTVSLYMQGMDGDKQKDGTTSSATVTGIDLPGQLNVADEPDSDQYQGFLREQITYDGSTAISADVNDPWSSLTASQQKSYANIKAYFVRTGETHTSTYLTASNTWRTHAVSTTYDSHGMPVLVNDSGQVGLSGDETCTRTWYARNTDVGITSLVSRVRETGHPCSTTEASLNLPTNAATRGDVLSDTATVFDNPSATSWTATQTPTKGEVSWTGRPTAYPASVDGNGERYPTSWQTTGTFTYDVLGRAITATDAGGNTTSTGYTPLTSGPVTKTVVTKPGSLKTTSFLDPARGTATMVFDANTKRTDTTYDALGRVTGVWLPNRSRDAGQSANYTYSYHLSNTQPSYVTTSTIKTDTTYTDTYAIYDSLLRPLQTQSPTPDGGRLLTDTRYDSRGLAYETYADMFDADNVPNGTYMRADYGRAPKQTETVFDGAERPITSTLLIFGVQKWSTTTAYTGDSTATSAPDGGNASRSITDINGRTVETREYAGTNPADSQYGAGVGTLPYTRTKFTYTRDGKPLTVTGPDDSQWTYGYDLFGRQTKVGDPDTGTTTTGYTNLDQKSWTRDADGHNIITAYDALGRVTGTWSAPASVDLTVTPVAQEETPANRLSAYTYDGVSSAKGQLDSSTSYDSSGAAYTHKITAYDSLYRPTATELDLPSTDALVTSGAVSAKLAYSTAYNVDGTQQYVKDPAAGGLSSETVSTTYDSVGLPTALGGATGYLLDTSYSALGQPEQLTLGTANNDSTKKAYVTNTYEDGTDRLLRSNVTDQTHPYMTQDLHYTYDDAGNVTSISDPATLGGTGAADNQCFSYDGYRRLIEAWTPTTADCSASGRTTGNLGGAAPYWTSYTYSDNGLRQTETDRSPSTTTTQTYCYDPSRPHALTAVVTSGACTGTTAAYQYDASGNTTERPVNGASGSGGAEGLTWNSQGLLDTVTTTSGSTTSTTKHVYDTDGNLLIRRDTSGETVLYLGDTEVHLDTAAPGGHVWAERYYTANGAAVAVRSNQTGSQTLSYLASDQHGTSTLAWDATTQSVTKRYFTAFGASRNGGTGTWPDDKSFLGASADQDTGLTYLGAREYDPTTGRFLSVDPLLQTDRPQTLNGYTYAGNNPASFSDPSGKGLKCGQGDTPCPPVNPQDVYNATPKSSGTSGTSSTGSHGDTSGQGSGAPYAPDPYSEGNEYNPADFQPLPGVPDYVPAGVASSRYLQQRECAISPIELACNPQDADLDCADCGGLRRVGLKWALGKLDYFDESDYGEDSPVAHELERTDLVAKQRSEIARDYLTRGEMAGKLKSYSIASLKSPFARFLSDTRSILTGKGDVATAVLGSYTSEFQVLRSSPRGIQVRVTVNDDMTISSFAHVITGYNTPASRYLQNNVDGSGISLSDADGLGAGRSLSITFREVIRF